MQESCRGKHSNSFLLMSLAGDAGSFKTILISKFVSKVFTSHSAFLGTKLTVSFASIKTS